MNRLGVFFFVLLALNCTNVRGQAPATDGAVAKAMQRLSFMQGTWKGDSTMTMGPDRKRTSQMVERGRFALQNSIFIFEGQGTAEGPGAKPFIVHDAMGIISYDAQSKEYRLRTYRAGGETLDADIDVGDNKIVWSFSRNGVGKIRFTLTVTEGNRWTEIGEMSRDDGKTWMPFFEMNLNKVK